VSPPWKLIFSGVSMAPSLAITVERGARQGGCKGLSHRRRQSTLCQVGFHPAAPQRRYGRNAVTVGAWRRLIFVERAFAAGLLEGGEVRAAMRQRIERIVVAIQPDRRLAERRTALEQALVDGGGVGAAGPHPAADEVDGGA